MPIDPLGVVSLTKFVGIADVVLELALVTPGVTTALDVRALPKLNPLWNDLLVYDPPLESEREAADRRVVVADELTKAAGERRADAPLLVWCALLIADARLDEVVRTVLTTSDGKLDRSQVNAETLLERLTSMGVGGEEPRKVVSNILRNMVDAGIIEPELHGGMIVGVRKELPTAHAVPGLVRLLLDRANYWGAQFRPDDAWPRAIDFACALGAHHWLNLTREEFERGASHIEPPEPLVRQPATAEMRQLAELLEKKGQVVLQGPPGTGKTYLAKQYVEWATAGRRDESRLQSILDKLPSQERTPVRVADEVQRQGLMAVWDVVQFHPSYEYNDFVRTLVAQPVAGGVSFVPQHRVLSFIAAVGNELEARGSTTDLVLILDEINRGNIPSIFGELLYALEYRGEPVSTPHSIDGSASIVLPRRLQVVGTMNTADRSIAVIDYALRRRFVFLDVPATEASLLAHEGFTDEGRAAAVYLYWQTAALLAGSSSGVQVGPSYFMPPKDSSTDQLRHLATSFVFEVVPLLNEYVLEGELPDAALSDFLSELGIQESDAQGSRVGALQARLVQMTVPAGGKSTPGPSEG